MFINGDIVRIRKEHLGPNETDQLYRVVNTNTVTKRCYIELVHTNLPLSPQELVSFDMIEPFRDSNTVDVSLTGQGMMKGTDGCIYVCDADGYGHPQNLTTGELFYISKRDNHEYPISIIPLSAMEV